VDAFLHCLTDEPTRCAILAGQPSGDAFPVPLVGVGDLFAKTCCGGGEFSQGGLEVAIVVAMANQGVPLGE
jgi:hypothetical protein